MIEGDDLHMFERSLRHATENHTGAALDTMLQELGWTEALAADARSAVSLLFELQGAANAVSSALDRVLSGALGHRITAVVLPVLGQWSAPAALDGDWLDVRGIGTTSLSRAETALIVAQAGASHVATEVETASLERRTIEGLDPRLGLAAVEGRIPGAQQLGTVDWPAAVALGQLAVGYELVGASRRMLQLAAEHALERVQFGRPVAKFQAIRHRLAETLVAIEAADAVLGDAWLDPTPQAAGMGKAIAGRAARVAARHCQQVLAGMGFTTEHPFHRYVKRVFVLEQLLGSTRRLTRELGREILEQRQLPPLLPL